MSNVLNLSGQPIMATDDGTIAVPEIIARFEELLEQARLGRIRAMAVALVRPDCQATTMFEVGTEPLSHHLMAAITYLQHRYAAHKLETSEALPAHTA